MPFEEMPRTADPPGGVLATANNSPAPKGTGPFLEMDWLDGYRVTRVLKRLESRRDWDVESTLALHMDEYCVPWREVREAVLATRPPNEDARQAIALLEGWDGVLSADSSAASVFQYFLAEVYASVAKARAPRS